LKAMADTKEKPIKKDVATKSGEVEEAPAALEFKPSSLIPIASMMAIKYFEIDLVRASLAKCSCPPAPRNQFIER